MRIRGVLAIALVLLPVGLSAQRLPRIRGRFPPRAEPPGVQLPGVARELAYKRSRISVESYPLISYTQAPGVGGSAVAPKRTTFGAGTRADYRMTRHVSATLDMTATLPGGPTSTETAEVGLRLRPERTERRVYPFVDVRVGYLHAYNSFVRPFDVANGSPDQVGYGGRYSQGLGGVGGAGMEYALTRRFSLTTGATVLRSGMTTYSGYGAAPASSHYMMTVYRFTLGLRYNPVHLIFPTGST